MKTLEVVAGVVYDNERIMVAKKPENHRVIPGKWEFPGGRIEDGESDEEALKRELSQEMDGFEVNVEMYLGEYVHSYDGKTEIRLRAYLCTPRNEPNPLEHDRIEWPLVRDLVYYDLAVLDRKIADKLIKEEIENVEPD